MKPDSHLADAARRADHFWTRGKVVAAAVGVVLTIGAGLVAQGRWTERMTAAVETIAEDHGYIEQRLDRLAAIVEAHVKTPAHAHQSALNHELRALATAANSKVDEHLASAGTIIGRWFSDEWPEHIELHRDIEARLRRLEGKR